MKRLRDLAGLIVSTLREIFDENAYARFLIRKGKSSSAITYSEFVREQEDSRARRPRCC
jgi:hypothetical protein